MSLPEQIWQKCFQLCERGRRAEAIETLEAQVPHCSDPSELALVARRLAEYCQAEGREERAISYYMLTAQCYIREGRMAPAVAVLNILRELPRAAAQVAELRAWLAETFSQAIPAKKKPDDDLPPPTPFKEIRASVSFERADFELSRDQWARRESRRTVFFSDLPRAEVDMLLSVGRSRDLAPGEVLFREGDDPTSFYIVAEGEMRMRSSLGCEHTFREGDFFGEVALLAKTKRTATLDSPTGARLLEFTGAALSECCRRSPALQFRILNFYEKRIFRNISARSEMFKELSPSERDDVFDLFTSVYVPVGRVLIEQGAKADRFFFIVTGRLEVSKDQEFVRHLGPGQFVGEIGLLKKSQRLAKVVTLTDCHLLECHSEIFDEMIERFPLIRRHLEEVAENRAQGLYISDPLLID